MKRIMIVSIALFALSSLARAATLPFIQSSANQKTGTIMGVLLDVNDVRITHAKIKVEGTDFKWEGESNDAGEFSVEVPAGKYLIQAYAQGFRRFESPSLNVKPTITEMINLHLEAQLVIDTVYVRPKKPPKKN